MVAGSIPARLTNDFNELHGSGAEQREIVRRVVRRASSDTHTNGRWIGAVIKAARERWLDAIVTPTVFVCLPGVTFHIHSQSIDLDIVLEPDQHEADDAEALLILARAAIRDALRRRQATL